MLDMSRIDELRNDFGEDDFEEIVALFLKEVEQRLTQILRPDCTDLPGDLHFIKGSASNLGFVSVKAACEEAEKQPSTDTVMAVVNKFDRSVEVFFEVLEDTTLAA